MTNRPSQALTEPRRSKVIEFSEPIFADSVHHPFVFDLLIVRRCALRRCFFLASRASAYLFIAVGEADFFSAFALVSGTVLGSELTTGVVLIIFLLQFFFTGMPTLLAPVDLSYLRGNRVLKAFSTQDNGGPIQRWRACSRPDQRRPTNHSSHIETQ